MPSFIIRRIPLVNPTISMEDTIDFVDSIKVLQISVAEYPLTIPTKIIIIRNMAAISLMPQPAWVIP